MGNRFNVSIPVAKDPKAQEAQAVHVKEIAASDYEAEVVKAALPVVLDFYGTESKACEALAPRLAAVAERFAGKVRFLKILRRANGQLAERLGVTASPTLVFLRAGKEIGERLSGEDIKRTEVKARVEALLGIPVVGHPA
jgi:thioredoxin-like negative regulator of GroEL